MSMPSRLDLKTTCQDFISDFTRSMTYTNKSKSISEGKFCAHKNEDGGWKISICYGGPERYYSSSP